MNQADVMLLELLRIDLDNHLSAFVYDELMSRDGKRGGDE